MNLDGVQFHIEVNDGQLEISLGAAGNPKVNISTSGKLLASLGKGNVTLEEAIQSGKLQVEGSVVAAKRMFRLFTMK